MSTDQTIVLSFWDLCCIANLIENEAVKFGGNSVEGVEMMRLWHRVVPADLKVTDCFDCRDTLPDHECT